MVLCVKCGAKLDPGMARCPSCKTSLMKPGGFVEVLGWVVAIVSAIPIIVGSKTVAQEYYPPLIVGIAVLLVGITLAVVGRSQSRTAEATTREETSELPPA